MAFVIKTFLQITSGMIATMRASNRTVTDYNVGSVARTMLEAPSAEIDELYQNYGAGLVEAIPTAIYISFNFNLLPAIPASGVVTITAPAAQSGSLTLPVGTLVGSVSGAQYATTQPLTLAPGASASVLVACTVAGVTGNASAGDVGSIATPGLAVTVSNALAFTNGAPIETSSQRKSRFVAYVASLSRGTVASMIYAAGTAAITDPTTGLIIEQVTRVAVDESQGYLDLYFWNGVGNVSAALLALVTNLIEGYADPATGAKIPGYRPAGMRCDKTPMVTQAVPVSISVAVPVLSQTTALQAAVSAAIAAAIIATPSGGNLSTLTLQDAALGVPGVTLAQLNSPVQAIACPLSAVLMPGAISVSWL